jgi:hypothetical protein
MLLTATSSASPSLDDKSRTLDGSSGLVIWQQSLRLIENAG